MKVEAIKTYMEEQFDPNSIDKKFSKSIFNSIIFQVYAAYSLLYGTFIIFETLTGAIGDIKFYSVVGAIFILSGILLLLFSKKRWKLIVFLPSFFVYVFASFFLILLTSHSPDLIEILIVISALVPTLIGITYLVTYSS